MLLLRSPADVLVVSLRHLAHDAAGGAGPGEGRLALLRQFHGEVSLQYHAVAGEEVPPDSLGGSLEKHGKVPLDLFPV